jgi:hypothetical protein
MILMSLIDLSTSDGYDNCVGDCAVDAVNAVGTEQELENEHTVQVEAGQSTDSTSFIWEDMENYSGQHDIVAVFLMFFNRDLIDEIVVETNFFTQQFINSKIFPLRSIANSGPL